MRGVQRRGDTFVIPERIIPDRHGRGCVRGEDETLIGPTPWMKKGRSTMEITTTPDQDIASNIRRLMGELNLALEAAQAKRILVELDFERVRSPLANAQLKINSIHKQL